MITIGRGRQAKLINIAAPECALPSSEKAERKREEKEED
jgi:hypothetical protein